MKTFYLVFSRIKQYFKSNKLIFCLFIIGGISCAITFIYFYGNMVTVKKNSGKNDEAYRTYTIDLSSPQHVKSDELKSYFRNYGVERMEASCVVPQKELACVNIGATFTKNTKNGFYVKTPLSGGDTMKSVKGRTQFTEQELKDGERVVVIPMEFLRDNNMPESLKIQGIKYRIIGISIDTVAFYIPPSAFDRDGFAADRISVLLQQRLSEKNNQSFTEKLKRIFPQSEISGPDSVIQSEEKKAPKEILMISIVYLISLISFMFLMKFMVDVNSSENIIYSLVGAAKHTVMKIIALENFVLNLFIGLFSIAIHVLLRNAVFEKVNTTAGIQYETKDYMIILLVMLAVSVLVQLPFLWNYYRNTMITLKNKYVLED
ncbi:hypothetical protein CAFE_17430 [Caprobacter fermentans]|uniref:ABC3 transporter permease C-terminal domain-containing protein n=1 Tax=Caproicibacter fermentans TaxID=2576756 RepID=A0A6N8HYW9_9FIRM|nr:FtsX-like permease family protein [Caproicibacter fermentans]MVB11041.1 hypothetical protein [Caproicibacter fermentans]